LEKQLLLFGLMRKAGRIAVGDEPVSDGIRRREVVAVCVASDAAQNTKDRFARYSEEEGLAYTVLPSDKSALGRVLGRESVAVVGITDVGFASRLWTMLSADAPDDDKLAAVSERLRKRADAVLAEQRRKREMEKAAKKNPRGKKPASPVSKSEDAPKPAAQKFAPKRDFTNREAPGKVYGKAPGSGGVKPTLGDRRRQDAEKKREHLAASDRKPYTADRKPFNGGQKPFSGERKPFDGEQKPFSGERKPFDGEHKSFKGERKPFKGDQKPFNGDRKPYTGKPAYKKKTNGTNRGNGGKV
jgi:ribosomal protein L7Ae-like RNA K-turn-binding protein